MVDDNRIPCRYFDCLWLTLEGCDDKLVTTPLPPLVFCLIRCEKVFVSGHVPNYMHDVNVKFMF